jgi:hypothetical protein
MARFAYRWQSALENPITHHSMSRLQGVEPWYSERSF